MRLDELRYNDSKCAWFNPRFFWWDPLGDFLEIGLDVCCTDVRLTERVYRFVRHGIFWYVMRRVIDQRRVIDLVGAYEIRRD